MAEGHRNRLVEKVLKYGVDILHEHEFLELYLFFTYKRADTNGIAHRLIDKFGDLDNVCGASIDELTSVEGVGLAAAKAIKLLPHISRGFLLNTSVKNKASFSSVETVYKRCVALLGNVKNETVYLLCLDSKNHLIKEIILAEGMPGRVNIEPRKITDAIAGTATTSVVLCHNHPSGEVVPSPKDIEATSMVKDFLSAMGISLIDHVIVADNKAISCVSLKEIL